MKFIKYSWILFLVTLIGTAHGTCVFESNYGFVLDCAFKKSGLFRVRNLGGLKAHVGLGFSFGDDLGFNESLGYLEGDRRRSVSGRSSSGFPGTVSAAKMSPAQSKPIQQSRPHALTVRPPVAAKKVETVVKTNRMDSGVMSVPVFRPIPMKEAPKMTTSMDNMNYVTNVMNRKLAFSDNLVPTQINAMAYDIPQFQHIPGPLERVGISNNFVSPNSISSFNSKVDNYNARGPIFVDTASSTPIYDPFMIEPTKKPLVDLRGHSVEELAQAANVSVDVIKVAIKRREQYLLEQKLKEKQQLKFLENYNFDSNGLDPLPQPTHKPIRRPTTARTSPSTSTTTSRPKTQLHGGHKVMNAPKEYYPVGYEKNFDDNFQTKVDLPHTTFHCGDQRHFPGLYADEDLGCMVFHVCALTDDGLIMKSFLCPESTLFDQTVLKCNWWFYVECKNSKNLYDSNIPVSKSYQLMKALTFFSSNYKDAAGGGPNGVDVQALKESVDRNHKQLNSNLVEITNSTATVSTVSASSSSSHSNRNNSTTMPLR